MGLPAVVLTFCPHPAVVLGGQAHFRRLTTPIERAEILAGLGVDAVVIHPFTRELAAQTAEAFMQYVRSRIGVRRLLVGYDFALGRGREGDAARLAEIGRETGYDVETIPVLAPDGDVISSTRIRQRVSGGQVAEAAADMGRFFAITGPVIHGDGRGRKINIPTANIEVPEDKLLPANGVYACWVWVDGQKHLAVTNVGIRPTFKSNELSENIETHILDFDQNLYGEEIKLEFVSRLRNEMKFSSVEALVTQITKDIARAREILG
jgi:riboflavin kinase/FMN adenylyltransferase